MNKSCANAIKPGGMCTWNWPLIKPDRIAWIGSDSGSDRITDRTNNNNNNNESLFDQKI